MLKPLREALDAGISGGIHRYSMSQIVAVLHSYALCGRTVLTPGGCQIGYLWSTLAVINSWFECKELREKCQPYCAATRLPSPTGL
jgi:hypothetical protein